MMIEVSLSGNFRPTGRIGHRLGGNRGAYNDDVGRDRLAQFLVDLEHRLVLIFLTTQIGRPVAIPLHVIHLVPGRLIIGIKD